MKKENKKIFLTAEWRKLIMANYAVEPAVLQKFLPANTEPDTWNDTHYVSLVGFMFKQVKVKGIKIPFHVNFPEVNLRFYVRVKENNEWKRGVVFISEIVPKPAISFIANTLYKEHYSTLPMKHRWENDNALQYISYQWKKKGKWNSISVTASQEPEELVSGSEEEFITEHFYGYSKLNKQTTNEYEVAHPRWKVYKPTGFAINCNFETVYGNDFAFLNHEKPISVFLAEGSGIKIFGKRVVK
jgi:uncharacterized protein YqjF (DUF2071 family)